MGVFDQWQKARQTSIASVTPPNSDGSPMTYGQFSEIERIVNMGLDWPLTDEELEAYNKANVLASAFERGFRLRPSQAAAMLAFEATGGLFGNVGVGHGKTLIALGIAGIALRSKSERVLLYVPAPVYPQLTMVDIQWARGRIRMDYPIHYLSGLDRKGRKALAMSRKRGLYIATYPLLSTADGADILDWIRPGTVILDECQHASRKVSARGRRLLGWLNHASNLDVNLAVESGTLTSKSVMDYWEFARRALGKHNPLPNSSHLVQEWAAVLDAGATVADELSPVAAGPMEPLITWARKHFPQQKWENTVANFRRAYQLRLNTAPGVVSTGDASVGTSLIFHNEPVQGYKECPGYAQVEKFADQVQTLFLTPNGDEIEYGIHVWKWLNEFSAGFYNEQVWPTVPVLAKRKQIPEGDAKTLLDRAMIHHIAHQEYARQLRTHLQSGDAKKNLDTPMLIGGEMSRNADKNVPSELYKAWSAMKGLEFDGMPERDSRSVRLCPFKINAAVDWAKKLPSGTGGIVWYYHQEVGIWLAEEMLKAGVDVLHCPAGKSSDIAITDKKNVSKVIVASIPAHREGKNLQHFQEQFFVQFPRCPRMAEQVLGRVHRQGQLADEIVVSLSITTYFEAVCLAATLNDSLYIHQTTTPQKLIYGVWEPLPFVFPAAVLLERGLQPTVLTRSQQQMMFDRFGPPKESLKW